MILSFILTFIVTFLLTYSFIVFLFLYKRSCFRIKCDQKHRNLDKICAFFHPSCYSGGGGERVLWEAVKSLQSKYNNMLCVIYCDNVSYTDEKIIEKVKNSFGITLNKPVEIIRLKYCRLLNPGNYKRFTLIGQSLGSIIVGFEAILKCVPHVYIDTVGYAFTLPIFKCLALCKTISYVHYPTISLDMIQFVSERKSSYTNNDQVANNLLLTKIKLRYYRGFSWIYGFVGKACDVTIVNSQWTKNHIDAIWRCKSKLIYPPCDLSPFKLTKSLAVRKPWIISVGQFRPEKNHSLQLEAFSIYLKKHFIKINKSYDTNELKMILIGGCRNVEDWKRVDLLKAKCDELGITNYVNFKCDVPHDEMIEIFNKGLIGLHTMESEHFGIAIVESMAAGLVTIANNSGGPKLDIIDESVNGFLAYTADEYADYFHQILSQSSEYWDKLRCEANIKSQKFSTDNFDSAFIAATAKLMGG